MSAAILRWSFLFMVLAVSTISRAADRATIIFFGDSITAGYGLDDPSSDAYPALVQKKIDQAQLPWRAVNAGLSGETTAGGLRRVDWVLREKPDVFVLALGGNDGLRGLDPSISKKNLQAIIDRVRAKNPKVKIVLAGMMMPAMMGEDFTKAFAAVYPDLAAANHLVLMPFLLTGVGGNPDLNQPDLIHPTERGHAIIATAMWKVLKPLLSNAAG